MNNELEELDERGVLIDTTPWTDMQMQMLVDTVLDIHIKGNLVAYYTNEHGVRCWIGKPNTADSMIELGDISDGGWRRRIIRFLRGDYLAD